MCTSPVVSFIHFLNQCDVMGGSIWDSYIPSFKLKVEKETWLAVKEYISRRKQRSLENGRKQKLAFCPLAWKDLKPSLACQKRVQVQITLFPLLILPPIHRCSVSNTNFEAPKPF